MRISDAAGYDTPEMGEVGFDIDGNAVKRDPFADPDTDGCDLVLPAAPPVDPDSDTAVAAMLDGLELYGMGASWGGYESLILPSWPGNNRTATQWSPGGQSMRVHVGLEDIDDLIADLEAGLARYNAA